MAESGKSGRTIHTPLNAIPMAVWISLFLNVLDGDMSFPFKAAAAARAMKRRPCGNGVELYGELFAPSLQDHETDIFSAPRALPCAV